MNKKIIIISLILIVGIIIYSTSFNMEKNNKMDTDKMIAYVNGKRTGDIPGKNDGYVVDKIECTNNATATWNNNTWGILITDLSETDTRCSVYFVSNGVYEFSFDPNNDGEGQAQTFTVPKDGTYKLEVWGAQGGSAYEHMGGYGGYSVGTASLTKNEVYYIVVGGEGISLTTDSTYHSGGYNGGGITQTHCPAEYIFHNSTGAGGGATHIAKVSGELKDLSSYRNTGGTNISNEILIVASGGGGGLFVNDSNMGAGGHGGGISGVGPSDYVQSTATNYPNRLSYPATQTSGGCTNGSETSLCGGFGYGGATVTEIGVEGCYRPTAGGGAGWYGGGGSWYNGGSGGSGYIGSSNLGSSNGITKHMTCYNCATNNSTNTKTETNTCHDSTPTSDCAKEGNGYARITYLGN